jgi:hypothetical protein
VPLNDAAAFLARVDCIHVQAAADRASDTSRNRRAMRQAAGRQQVTLS